MTHITVRLLSMLCVACLTLMVARRASAQTPVAEYYDVSKPITLTGTHKVIWYPFPPTPTCLLIEVQDARGRPELWMVVGHPARVLQRSGWQPERLKGGDTITISAYRPKTGSRAAAVLAEMLEAQERTGFFLDELKKPEPRLAYGFEITLKDGTKLAFGERQ